MDKKKSAGWKVIERAKRKSNENMDTLPIGCPALNDPFNTPLSDPVQISPEKRFINLLDFLNLNPILYYDFNPEKDHAFLATMAGLPLLASPEHGRYFMTVLKPIAIKIMESGIFFNGGLKGNILSHNPIIYDSYPIENIDQFIFGLASVLYRHEMSKEYPSAFQLFTLFEAGKKFNLFISGVEIWKGKRAAQPLKTLLSQIETLALEADGKPDDCKPSSLETFAREMTIRWGVDTKIDATSKGPRITTKAEIVGIFVKHIKAPGTVIAERVKELLKLFEIKAKSEALRKKLPKKHQTL